MCVSGQWGLTSWTCVGISCRNDLLGVGMWKLPAEIPPLKRWLTQAEFEKCKCKLAEAARMRISGRLGPTSSAHVGVLCCKRFAQCLALCRCSLKSGKFLSDFGLYISPVSAYFLAYPTKTNNRGRLIISVPSLSDKDLFEQYSWQKLHGPCTDYSKGQLAVTINDR